MSLLFFNDTMAWIGALPVTSSRVFTSTPIRIVSISTYTKEREREREREERRGERRERSNSKENRYANYAKHPPPHYYT